MNFLWIDSPVGRLTLREEGGKLCGIEFGENACEKPSLDSALLAETARQIKEYFDGARKVFDLPLNENGTEFQRRIYRALGEIPYGETASYKDIAERAGNVKAVRAVGNANNKNPIAIVVPCHRVIGSGGKLVGYAGGLDKKQFLLDLEKRNR